MKAYSVDLRIKVVESLRRGISKSETARRFGVSRWTLKRYYLDQLDHSGSLAPKRAPGKPPKLDECAMQLLEEDIEARPSATHGQRREFFLIACGVEVIFLIACGVEVSEATICRAIKKRLSHSRKKDRCEPTKGTSG